MSCVCRFLARAPRLAVCVLAIAPSAWLASAAAEESPGDPIGAQSFFPTPLAVPSDGAILQVDGEKSDDADATRERLRIHIVQKGSSSRTEMEAAIARLPLAELTAADRRKVSEVIDSISLFRRLPTVTCEADPRTYQFFADCPDVAVSIWRVMGISEMEMRQVSEREYETDLKDGSGGLITVLYKTPELRIAMCEGEFKSPLLVRPIRSTGLLAVQTKFWQDEFGRSHATHTADMFVAIHSETVEAIARLISPVSFKMADRNFEEVTLFLRMMDEAMATQPGWMEQTADRLEGVLPGRDAELLEVTADVYVDAQRRMRQERDGPVSLDAIRPPIRSASGQALSPR